MTRPTVGSKMAGLMLPAVLVAMPPALAVGCSPASADTVSTATAATADPAVDNPPKTGGTLIVLASAPDGATARIARAMADKLGATLLSPGQAAMADLSACSLVGFGSGIFDQRHHGSILEAAERLPLAPGTRVFIFSTSGVSRDFALKHGIDDPHKALRGKLAARGCRLVGEFNCAGFNDNSFLKLFGGMNKGRPNGRDLDMAREFASHLGS
jgi:flavodoxin